MNKEGKHDFNLVPLVALRTKTRCIISQMLNSSKVIPSPAGFPRDWRGLAQIADVPLPSCNCPDPTENVIKQWEKKNVTFESLSKALEELDRWDVLDDVKFYLNEDVTAYFIRSSNQAEINLATNLELDQEILTIDDIHRLENGLEPQYYDAFLLYSDDDLEFAMEIVDKLENVYHLKLCLKDRDLIGGVSFEHEAIMRLISERCNRLIPVVSPSFLNSPANKFLVTFAQALGIEQKRRKIVPCLYKKMILPLELSYYFVLDYNRTSQLWNFWERLNQSVVAPTSTGSLPSRIIHNNNDIPKIVGNSELPQIEAPPSVEIESLKSPNEWDCKKEELNIVQDMKQLKIETEVKVENVSKKHTTSLLKKLLPSPPSTKLDTRKWFKKKKKLAITS